MKEKLSFVEAVRTFTKAVGQTTETFNARQTGLYIGLQLEEMSEKLTTILSPFELRIDALDKLSEEFKRGDHDYLIEIANREEMLDADIDLAWVTFGSAFSQGADVHGAAIAVQEANMNKLVDCPSCPSREVWDEPCPVCKDLALIAVKDANGKVVKPEGWKAPDIKPFVRIE